MSFNTGNYISPVGSGLSRENYRNEIFKAYILPWNCHDLNEKQNYFYTHRYKAVFGFEFSYVSVGARKPELEDAPYSAVGFYSTYGRTSWLIFDSTDERIDVGHATSRALKDKWSQDGTSMLYYNGLFFNAINSVESQQNNFSDHYARYIYEGLVNTDRGVNSYFEQTYWKHVIPGHWEGVPFIKSVPAILGIKPCSRSEFLVEFFKGAKSTFKKLNFLDYFNYEYSGVNTSHMLLDRPRKTYKRFRNMSDRYNFYKLRQWKLFKSKLDTRYQKRACVWFSDVWFNNVLKFDKSRNKYLLRWRKFLWLKARSRAYARFKKKKLLLQVGKKAPGGARKRRFVKKFRLKVKCLRRIAKHVRHEYDTEKNFPDRLSSTPFKKGLAYLSPIHKKKLRRNVKSWFLEGGSPHRRASSAYKAISYRKKFRRQRYIYVF